MEEINNILLSYENICEATKKYSVLNDNFEIKTLFYISEINKINDKTEIFFKSQYNPN